MGPRMVVCNVSIAIPPGIAESPSELVRSSHDYSHKYGVFPVA